MPPPLWAGTLSPGLTCTAPRFLMAQDFAERSCKTPSDRHGSSESHMKMSEDTSARLRGCGTGGVSAAELVGPRPWQPALAAPSGNSIDDLKKLKS
ncbi:hypothetical protein ABZP36_022790 [Zizania latifolia]